MRRSGHSAAACSRWRAWPKGLSLFTLVAVLIGLCGWTMVVAIGLLVEAAGPTHQPRLLVRAPPTRLGAVTLTQDAWHERLLTPQFWASRGQFGGSGTGFSMPELPRAPNVQKSDTPREHGDTYRTLCARMCDGYYWPISYATTRRHFARDESACKASCQSPTRLFVHRSSDETDGMEDIAGNPYAKLGTAYRYRTTYDPDCKCRPHPWEPEARTRHRLYALDAARRRGNSAAAAEFRALQALTGVELPAPIVIQPSATPRTAKANTNGKQP